MSSETQNLDLTKYETRLKTFNSEWKLTFLTPSQMANAGFHYIGVHDRVGCIYCSKEFDSWEQGEDPLVEHKRQSPECAFFRESSGFDVCGLYSSLPTDVNANEETNNIQDFLSSVGILFNIDTPKVKECATLESRLVTFEKCKMKLKQPPHCFAEAGFLYIGNGEDDQMICFYCGQGLRDWEDDDEPWTEHARWSRTCSFVLLTKGKSFVDEAHGIKNNDLKRSEEELPKLIADCKNMSNSKKNIKLNLMNKKPNEPESAIARKIPKLKKKKSAQKQDPNVTPDYMLCKICFKEEMKLAFIPCGHVLACVQCTITLDSCAVCRQPFNMVMEVNIAYKTEVANPELPCSSSQSVCEDEDPMLCKVCQEEEMEAAFLPCKHVYACGKCATDVHDCPICSVTVRATVQVYL